jgi:hypothetical protein
MELDALITEVEDRSPSDQPLDRLSTAALRHEELTDRADLLLDHFVQVAREAKCSWAQIGDALGVTKQAAQQRHAKWRGPGGLVRGFLGKRPGLFQRFSERARTGVVDAQETARSFNHDHVGTEHVLMGILSVPDSTGARLLARWEITRPDVEAEIEQRVGKGDPDGKLLGHIRFDAHSKKALELALRESMALGDGHIGTEHVVLGILRGDGGPGAAILRDRGVTLDEARAAVTAGLDDNDNDDGDPSDED